MSSDLFTHDKGTFDPVTTTGGVEIIDAEARYAELVTQVIWDGAIPHQRRPRLDTAGQALGLSPARMGQIDDEHGRVGRLHGVEDPGDRMFLGDRGKIDQLDEDVLERQRPRDVEPRR